MASEGALHEGRSSSRRQLSAAELARLERTFQHAGKKTAKGIDCDYATELLGQCVVGDPSNVKYVRAYIENLQKKYDDNKRGSPLAQFKERGARNALKKALVNQQWDEAVRHGLKVLAVNPWDVLTLTRMATAAKNAGDYKCELHYLKTALVGAPKDLRCNRLFAIALGECGLLDQAIAIWHRVEEFLPNDEEAKRAIANLTIQKANSRGDFNVEDDFERKRRVVLERRDEMTREEELHEKIQAEPKNLAYYLELIQVYMKEQRFDDAEEVLCRAYEVSEGDPDIHEKWEDARLRCLRQKMAAAVDPEVKKRLQNEYLEKDVEVCRNRAERFPNHLGLKFDLGYRYVLTGRYPEAIEELQAARNDARRKGVCLLLLGQCFQHMKQYRPALRHYELAIHEIPDLDACNKKVALYVAGRLALATNQAEIAERHLTTLARLDFTFKDVGALLERIAKLRESGAKLVPAGHE